MTPFFIFIVFILISTFIRGLEQAETRRKVVKPKVMPTAEPKKSDVKPDRVSPTIEVGESKTYPTRLASAQRGKSHSKSNARLTKSSVLNGIIMAEILSPPKCKRR